MSFGKMNTQIDIISTAPVKDADGFVTNGDHIVASVRAYKEDRHGNERWANMAAFSEATALFRFRKIPSVEITTSLFIVCGDEQYRIISVEDVRGRGMYIEVLAEKQEGAVR
ncbi:head-tail adaptor protein [Dehalobacter sp.]|uniref:head-tail adaptor protein n=1 Tax=Dehalobacter sp. TaxID=1962289 RepID=UPI00258D2E77|nr:head-tail adaptor protein [Dehalobacter sp.]MDJ0304702.1 head-tail adaptor protein [Dehalobacter sp.]